MKKKQKLSGFEKRVQKRHKQQEEEYGRDEFLFGAEEDDDEEYDEETDEESDDEIDEESYEESGEDIEAGKESGADEGSYDEDDEPENEDDEPDGSAAVTSDSATDKKPAEKKPLIGNTTTMIADDIIARQLSMLADEMGIGNDPESEENDEDDSDFYTGEITTGSAESEAMGSGNTGYLDDPDEEYEDDDEEDEEYDDEDDSDFYTGEITVDPEDAATKKVPGNTTDFDFYDMPEAAEAAAMAAIAQMAEKEEAEAFAEAKLRAKRSNGIQPSKPQGKRSGSGVKHASKAPSGKKRSAASKKAASKASSKASSKGKKNVRADQPEYEEVKRRGLFGRIGGFISDMSTSDKLIIVTGILVLAVAIVSGSVFINARGIQDQVASFAEVGQNTAGIYVIGEQGLNASVSARADYAVTEEIIEEEPPQEEEVLEEIVIEEKGVTIVLKASSVQSDLKIKFSNKETGKLIPGIPFEVTVTSDSGKEYVWTDENKDGLIYHTDVPNGTYKVAMTPLEGEEYANYTMPAEVTGIKVTDKIEYKKVDVADEVKKESEVNAAAEDTAKQDTVVESVLTDTVEWVESTKTLLSGSEDGFTKIDKDSIVIPNAFAGDLFKGLFGEVSGRYRIPVMGAVGAQETDEQIARLMTEEQTADGVQDEESSDNTEEKENTDDSEKKEDSESGENEDKSDEKKEEDESGGRTEIIQSDESVTSVAVSESSVTLKVGETAKITATVTRADNSERGSVSWTTSDSGVASVSGGTITANGEGSATITATSNDDSDMFAICNVTVKPADEEDSVKTEDENKSSDTTPLKDTSGNQVYVKKDESGGYVAATVADLDKYSDFYVKSDASAVYMYTGWQTIDGNTYFFDKNGNFVTGDQIIQGVKYHFNSDGHLSTGSGTMGIDVSKWNGSIDWNAVKNSGVSYVIIRCGYRGSSTGALIEDPKFRANISGAKAAGIQVGAYFFTQAVNEVEAVEEASMAVSLCGGYGLNLPIFLDVEGSGGRGDAIGADMRTAVVKAFCQTVRNSGYAAGVYANKTWFTEKMHVSQLTSYKIWLAQYAASPTYTASRIDYWQYSSKGKVSGIKGNVDMNVKY